RALIACGLDGKCNDAEGLKVLNRLEPIVDIHDPEILQLYIDLNDDLPFSKQWLLTERIIENCSTAGERLQYRILLGNQLFEIGDIQGAKDRITQALELFQNERDTELSPFTRERLAGGLSFLGPLSNNNSLLDKARDNYYILLQNPSLNVKGKA